MKTLNSFLAVVYVVCFAPTMQVQANTPNDSSLTLLGAWTTGPCNAVSADSEFVYLAKGSTLEILDVSIGVMPVPVGRLLGDAVIIQIVLSGNHAYLVREYVGSNRWYSLSIVDITDPYSPKETATYELGWEGRGYYLNHRICVSGTYVFVPFSKYSQDTPSGWYSWLSIVDVSDPTTPHQVGKSGEYRDDAGAVYVSGGFAYVPAGGWGYSYPYGGLHIFDVSDPTDPKRVSFFEASAPAGYICIDRNTLYVSYSESLAVLDISTPSQPKQLGTCNLEHYGHKVVVCGAIAYATHDSALSVIDVSDPMNPRKITEVSIDDLVPINELTRDLGATTSHLYVAGGWNGLHILALAEPQRPVQVATYGASSRTLDCALSDNVLAVTHEGGGLSIVDVASPSSPKTLGYYQLELNGGKIQVEDHLAYIVGYSLVILDISDPTDVREIGKLDLGESASDIHIVDSHAYVILGHGGVKIINIDNPANPSEVGFCQALPYGSAIFVQGEYAYAVGVRGSWYSYQRLCVIDISDSSKPMVYGIFDGEGGEYSEVSVSGNHAYVASGSSTDISYDSWLEIIDVSSAHNPERACDGYYFGSGTSIAELSASNGLIFCAIQGSARGASGLKVLDAHDLSDIRVVAQFASAPARAVSMANGLVYLLADYGLYVLQSTLPTRVNQESESPTTFSLHQNYPNPFNPITTITYALPSRSHVTLDVFNTLGQKVATLVQGEQEAGYHEVQFNAKELASGVYLYQLRAGDFVQVRKLVLLR